MELNKIYQGEAKQVLQSLPDQSINICVTSPPYWGLRDYGVEGQLGLEDTPEKYVGRLVGIFAEIKRILKDDGTLWLNLGDSYNGSGGAGGDYNKGGLKEGQNKYPGRSVDNLKPKDLVGIPWRVAFALQDGGWYLRNDIIWHKPNPMPESVTDRCTTSHEHIFLLAKSKQYYYDQDAIREPYRQTTVEREQYGHDSEKHKKSRMRGMEKYSRDGMDLNPKGKNKRDVWNVSVKPFPDAHFAVYPPDLIRPCIKAGCPEDGTVLDPFFGAGTTGLVAKELERNYIGIELNEDYITMAEDRISEVQKALI